MTKYISLAELKGLLKAKLTEAPSLRKLAPTLDVSPATLSSLMVHAAMKPGPRLLRKLGYRAETLYTKAK